MARMRIRRTAILLGMLLGSLVTGAEASIRHRVGVPMPPAVEQTAAVECIARAIYWEVRGGSTAGRLAVAQVILNRAADPRWPSDPCAVVYQKVGHRCQFSWVCTSLRDRLPADAVHWYLAKRVATQAMRGIPDITGRALYFHAHYVAPGWRHLQPTTRIDGHIFYAERQR
jgi:spore germination cell wall hydrolase CwlJ-like protein